MSRNAESPGMRAADSQLPAVRITARRGIGRTLLTAFLVLTLVPIVLVAGVSTFISYQTAQTDAFPRLASVADLRQKSIEVWVSGRQHDLQLLVSEPATAESLRSLLAHPDATEVISATTRRLAAAMLASEVFARLFIIDASGNTVVSTDADLLGTSHKDQPYMQPLSDQTPFITTLYVPNLNAYQIVEAIPIFNQGGYVIGVLVAESNLDQLSQIVLTGARLAASDDSYLVTEDTHRFLTPTRFYHQADTLDTLGVEKATSSPGQSTYNNYNGVPVVGVYRVIPRLDVIMLTEQYTAEAFAGAQQQIVIALSLALLAAAVAAAGAYLVTRWIARPIVNLTGTATRIASGDLGQTAIVERDDEIGTLARTFNSMTAQLRNLIDSLETRVKTRTDQLRTSVDVGRAATSILDSDQLMREVVSLISERFGLYYAAVFTLDAEGQYAVLREATGEAGRILKQRGHKLEVGGRSMVGTAISGRRARLALDVGHEPVRFANPLLPHTRSEIALPLMVGERVLGALDVQSDVPEAFDESSTEVLQSMADQIAIALLNSESFSRSERQTHALALLNQLSRSLALAGSLDDIGQAVASSVTALFGPNRLSLALQTDQPALLSLRPLQLESESASGQSEFMPADQMLANQALTSDKSIYIADLGQLEQPYSDVASLQHAGVQSAVFIPLRVGERVLGTFNVGNARPNAFSHDEIDDLEQIAAQMAVAIDNRRLFEQTQRALEELDAVNRRLIGRAWDAYTQATGRLAGEWRAGEWVRHGGNGRQPDSTDQAIGPDQSLPMRAVQIPIQVRGESIGYFDLQPGEAANWTPDDITFAQALIDQVGQMIENARLLEVTERLARRERTINDINSRVRQSVKLDTILQTAVQELGQSLKATRVIVRIGEPGQPPPAADPAVRGNGRGEDHA